MIGSSTTNIFFNANNGNIALAQTQSGSQEASISTSIKENNNTTDGRTNSVNQTQQGSQQLSSPPPRTHEYTLIAENTTLEIAPGFRVDAWTYNGTIPGPTLTATEGDRVIVHFINKTPLPTYCSSTWRSSKRTRWCFRDSRGKRKHTLMILLQNRLAPLHTTVMFPQ